MVELDGYLYTYLDLLCSHRLLEEGGDPNEWDVFAAWGDGGVSAVVLRCGVGVRAFTVAPDLVMEVTEG